MGDMSIPTGPAVFPILMDTDRTDYMLNINDYSCPHRSMGRAMYVEEIDQIVSSIYGRRDAF